MGLLNEKVILVTGATKGIGRAIALRCVKEGAVVFAAGRSEKEGASLALDAGNSDRIFFCKTDLLSISDCIAFVEKAASFKGKIDGLVNDAGIFPTYTLLETEPEIFEQVFGVNIRAPFFLCREVIPWMQKNGGGSIVNVGSTNAYYGAVEYAAYACSKGSLLTLTKHIAKHYAKDQIRANWITVGWVASPGELSTRKRRDGMTYDDLVEKANHWMPMGRLQTGEDNADAAVFLLSDYSTQVTATEIHVTGGLVQG